jgi:hypothetical protein
VHTSATLSKSEMTDSLLRPLQVQFPDLANVILTAAADARCRIVRAAVIRALRNARLDPPLYEMVLAAIDSHAALPHQARLELIRVHEENEARYFEALRACGAFDRIGMSAERSFRRARGASAVLLAFNDAVPGAAAVMDIVYEALASSADEAALEANLWKVINGRNESGDSVE